MKDTPKDIPKDTKPDTDPKAPDGSTVPKVTDGDEVTVPEEKANEPKNSTADESASTPQDPSNGVPDALTGPGLHPEADTAEDLAPVHEAWNTHENTTGDTPEVSAPDQLSLPPAPIIEAPEQAVQAARNARPVFVDAVSPPPPPREAPKVDFTTQVNTVIQNNTNVTVVNNTTVVANRWTTIEVDNYHRPTFYNPYTEPFTVRYFYEGVYRTVWVPVGGRVTLTVPIVGIYPFTAVSRSHVLAGDFCGGSYVAPAGWVGPPPPSWRPPPPPVSYVNRTVYVPAAQRSVQVRKVTVVGRDASKPVGKQDTFMLNDSTLAWGQDKGNGQIDITATQTLPGVGPIDDGASLINLTKPIANPVIEKDMDNSTLWVVGGGLAVLLTAIAGVFGRTWRRPKAIEDNTTPIAWSREGK